MLPFVAPTPEQAVTLQQVAEMITRRRRSLVTVTVRTMRTEIAGYAAIDDALLADVTDHVTKAHEAPPRHCTFSTGEQLAALWTLEQRIGTGRWPSTDPAAMNAAP